eukprot:2330065-Rhodomonas_salina.2
MIQVVLVPVPLSFYAPDTPPPVLTYSRFSATSTPLLTYHVWSYAPSMPSPVLLAVSCFAPATPSPVLTYGTALRFLRKMPRCSALWKSLRYKLHYRPTRALGDVRYWHSARLYGHTRAPY